MNNNNFDIEINHTLYSKDTGKEINRNIRIKDTSIRNATELILI